MRGGKARTVGRKSCCVCVNMMSEVTSSRLSVSASERERANERERETERERERDRERQHVNEKIRRDLNLL